MEVNAHYTKPRLIFFGIMAGAVTLFVIFNYGKHMLKPGPELSVAPVQAERGSILDRNGKILAVQTTLYNVAVTRSAVIDKPLFASLISPVIQISEAEILDKLENNSGNFFYLKKKISENERSAIAETVTKASLRGIRLEPVINRTYPENRLASHVIGFLGDDGRGLTGIEYSAQNMLSPPTIPGGKPTNGDNIVLTIDSAIQYELEKIARNTMDSTSAEAVMLIAADAKTGEILSYVSEPSANLNEYSRSSVSERMDRPALYAYEPGSVFKIFSVSAALELGVVHDADIFFCDGAYTFTTPREETISIKCLDRHGWVTPRDVIRLSCNDGTGQIVEKAISDEFENKLREFGFGSKTGIELPGETTGIFNPSSAWSLRSKPTIAIGQELSVSALQMVEAATALTNGGKPLKLTLISKIYSHGGELTHVHEKTELNRVLSERTARLMIDYMQTTSLTGTGIRAAVGDVPMAVKTGTAQMLNDAKTGYSSTDFISSCIGIFPANDPQIILYLAIVKPVGESYGGRIAAPVVALAANSIIDQMGIARGSAPTVQHSGIIPIPKNKPVVLGDSMPDLTGVSKRMLTGLLERTDLIVKINGDGYVVTQSPEPGTPITKGMKIELTLE